MFIVWDKINEEFTRFETEENLVDWLNLNTNQHWINNLEVYEIKRKLKVSVDITLNVY